MNPQQLEYYSLFCGVFLYQDIDLSTKEFVTWKSRLTAPEGLFSYLKKTYHTNYFNHVFEEDADQKGDSLNPLLYHQTCASLLTTSLTFNIKDQPAIFQLTYFDRYIFSDGIGIYAIKVEFHPHQEPTYAAIDALIRNFRNLDSSIICDDRTVKLSDLIYEILSPGLTFPPDWDKHISKLKHYTIINDRLQSNFNEEGERTLFELAHAMPLGSVITRSNESPTQEYYQKVIREQSIEVYANWKAISLLDSFTRLSVQFEDIYQSWELDYFHIYVYCLYCKYRLHHFSDQWANASLSKKKAFQLKEKFLSFISDYSSSTISYKFLPNLLFEKMSASLEIQEELTGVEKKMNRLMEVAESKEVTRSAAGLRKPTKGSLIVSGFEYDILISYQPNDNRLGWVTYFVQHLQDELATIIKDPVNIYFEKDQEDVISSNSEKTSNKLKTVILVPIISHTYCDKRSSAWQNELLPFNSIAQGSYFGREVKLRDGNFSNRILPICIHELEEGDQKLFEHELSMALRPVDFTYREPGVNRPLKPDDSQQTNINRTSYRNQLNKLANAIKEVLNGMKRLQ